jgi:hypothetical protein
MKIGQDCYVERDGEKSLLGRLYQAAGHTWTFLSHITNDGDIPYIEEIAAKGVICTDNNVVNWDGPTFQSIHRKGVVGPLGDGYEMRLADFKKLQTRCGD